MPGKANFSFESRLPSIRSDDIASGIAKLRADLADAYVDENDKTLQFVVCQEGRLDILKYLIEDEKKENLNDQSKLLISAVTNKHIPIVQYLLQHGTYPDPQVLNVAAETGNLDLVRCIVEENLFSEMNILDVKTLSRQTPLLHAVRYYLDSEDADKERYFGIISYLIEKGADIKAPDHNPLYIAIRNGDIRLVQYLIENRKLDVNQLSSEGKSPLYIAIERGHKEIAEYLLKQEGVDVNLGHNKETPLRIAIKNNLTKTALILLEKNADLNKDDELLHLAVEKNELEVVEKLVEKGVPLDIANATKKTPLYIAANLGYPDIANFLIEKGANPFHVLPSTRKSRTDETPLFAALEATPLKEGHIKIAKAIINTMDKEMVNTEDNNRYTPIERAVKNGMISCFKLLAEKEADVSRIDKSGHSLLFNAAFIGDLDIVKYLIEVKKVNVNQITQDNTEWTPLHAAASIGHLEVVRYLLENGADFNLKIKDGRTPLGLASQMKFSENEKSTMRFLILWELQASCQGKPLLKQLETLLRADLREDRNHPEATTLENETDVTKLIPELAKTKGNAEEMLAIIKNNEKLIGKERLGFIEKYVLTEKVLDANKILIKARQSKFFGENQMPKPSSEELNDKDVRLKLIAKLKKYIARIESHLSADDINFRYFIFPFMKDSRAQNRVANYYLARDLLTELTKTNKSISEIFDDDNIKILRSDHPHNREEINSRELKNIIKDGQKFGELEKLARASVSKNG